MVCLRCQHWGWWAVELAGEGDGSGLTGAETLSPLKKKKPRSGRAAENS